MKNTILTVVLALLACSAVAENKPQPELTPDQVKISVVLMDRGISLTEAIVGTLNGHPAPFSQMREATYVVAAPSQKEVGQLVPVSTAFKLGMFLSVTPRLGEYGKVDVDVAFTKVDLDLMRKFKQGELDLQEPQISSTALTQTLSMIQGKETVVRFGPSVDAKEPPRYTLRMVATKL